MKRVILIIGLVFISNVFVGLVSSAASDDLTTKFLNPPDSTKPRCYWYWIDGHISKEGITRDLEAMKRAGQNLNPDTLKAAMETLSNYDTGGVFPPVNYSPTSHAPAEMVKFFKADVPNGKLVPITEWRKPK